MTFSVNSQDRLHHVQPVETNKIDGVKDAGDVNAAGGKSLVMYEKEVRNLSYTPSTPDLEETRYDGWDRQDKYKSVIMKLFAARLSIGANSIMCNMYIVAQLMLKTCQEIRKQNRLARSEINKAIQANIQAQASIQRSAAFRGALVGGIVCGMQAVGMVAAAYVQSKGFGLNEQTNELGGVNMAKEQMGMTEVLGDEKAATVQLNTVEKAASRVLGEGGVEGHKMSNLEKLNTARNELKAAQREMPSQDRMAQLGEVNKCQGALDKAYNDAVQEKTAAASALQDAQNKVPPNQQEIQQAEAKLSAAQKKVDYFEAKKQFADAGGIDAAKAKAQSALEAAQAKVNEIETAEVGEGKTFANQADKDAALQTAIDDYGKAVTERLAVNRKADLVQQVESVEGGEPYGATGKELGEKLDSAKKVLADRDVKYAAVVKKYNEAFGIDPKDNPENFKGDVRPELEKAAQHAAALDDVENYRLAYDTARAEYMQALEGEKTGAPGVTKKTVAAAELKYNKAAANYKLARAKQVKMSTDLKLDKDVYVGTHEDTVRGYQVAAKKVEGSLISNDANKLMTAGMLAQQIWNVMGQEGQQIVQAYKETMLAGVTALTSEERVLEDEKDQTKDLYDEFKQGIDGAVGLLKGVYTTESSSIDAIIRS